MADWTLICPPSDKRPFGGIGTDKVSNWIGNIKLLLHVVEGSIFLRNDSSAGFKSKHVNLCSRKMEFSCLAYMFYRDICWNKVARRTSFVNVTLICNVKGNTHQLINEC